ncbi:MAG: ribosome small subunit-dependent GTPase A [Cyclobacteriaceae bacterium]
MTGTVIKSMGLWYEVTDESRKKYNCRLKGKFKLQGKKISNPIAVGDRVTIAKDEADDEAWLIEDILPRDNYIIRKSPKKKGHSHIIASNVDQAVLIATLSTPKTSFGFIDRFLVTAEAFRIPAIIVFNKKDLLEKEELEELDLVKMEYKMIGYDSLVMSIVENDGVEEFKALLSGKTTLLSGHSGVGKSTIINTLISDADQKISEISEFSNKGIHTTTFAEMFYVDNTSRLIDTPGIKELGLAEIEKDELTHYFPELRDLFGKCKFHNCTHTHEPGCAIEEAYKEGNITPSRYDSYLSMLADDDNRR